MAARRAAPFVLHDVSLAAFSTSPRHPWLRAGAGDWRRKSPPSAWSDSLQQVLGGAAAAGLDSGLDSLELSAAAARLLHDAGCEDLLAHCVVHVDAPEELHGVPDGVAGVSFAAFWDDAFCASVFPRVSPAAMMVRSDEIIEAATARRLAVNAIVVGALSCPFRKVPEQNAAAAETVRLLRSGCDRAWLDDTGLSASPQIVEIGLKTVAASGIDLGERVGVSLSARAGLQANISRAIDTGVVQFVSGCTPLGALGGTDAPLRTPPNRLLHMVFEAVATRRSTSIHGLPSPEQLPSALADLKRYGDAVCGLTRAIAADPH